MPLDPYHSLAHSIKAKKKKKKKKTHIINQVSWKIKYITCVKRHFPCKFREIDGNSRRLEIQKMELCSVQKSSKQTIFPLIYKNKNCTVLKKIYFVHKSVCTGKIFWIIFTQLLFTVNKLILNLLGLLLFFAFSCWSTFFLKTDHFPLEQEIQKIIRVRLHT